MRRRRRWMVVLFLLPFVLVPGAVAFQSLPPHQSRDVAVPPRDATPQQVVRAYLEALDAHDCATAKALVTDAYAAETETWCRGVASLEHVVVRKGSGDDAVDATFDLDWRAFQTTGLDEGLNATTYSLVRRTPSGPWRIDSEFGG